MVVLETELKLIPYILFQLFSHNFTFILTKKCPHSFITYINAHLGGAISVHILVSCKSYAPLQMNSLLAYSP